MPSEIDATERNPSMFKKGNRLYSISTWMILVIAGLHTVGVLRKPMAPEEMKVIATMKSQQFQAIGLEWSIHDVLISIALTMSVLMIFMVVANFFVLYSIPNSVARRRWSLVNASFMWALAALYGVFQVPPPFLSFMILGIMFTVVFVRLGRGQTTS